jgi:hypothetical protein
MISSAKIERHSQKIAVASQQSAAPLPCLQTSSAIGGVEIQKVELGSGMGEVKKLFRGATVEWTDPFDM